ncbi:MAG TPA: amidohydrolase family protein [Acidobacteriota bacterium]|nr:amidohydrolase family protein [Acidobacteriota bacterium]
MNSRLIRVLVLVLGLVFAGVGLAAAGAAQENEAAAETDDAKDKKWDVNEPPGPTSEVPIETDSGTWLSLDVSPDGNEIVFDLLGDIYRLPMAGGEAVSLTSGMAWDMQPRFSPDGEHIAYTSDAGGGDNIWVMKRDGSEAKQLTKESFRLLNSPAWTPDGDYIAARKHFTSTRSLGAGEIWLYHRSGGGGLQMVERRNDQKDLGEPAFSPDGRYLYYSLDATSGSIFQYNKDPNTQIYQIRRLDRQTGETETMAGGPGGAIRPTPSPDAKHLAFIRRVRYQSTLFLQDLESGREWPIYDGLERDMQETWAVHGVYPSMAWTPDSRSIVFWARGKIHRVDAESKEVSNIPFTVKDSRKVLQALRFKNQVAPETFQPKMLRWVQVSPTGGQVVYSALGYLWTRDLPDGTPRRLTSQNEHFEYYPSYSRDGQSIAYIAWDDQDLASVRIAPASGGAGRAVTHVTGHYVEPAFTPDGSHLVYRKVSGGSITSPLYSRETGIYKIPVEGGEAVRLSNSGTQPHFGADDERLYLLDFEDGKRVLKSIGLDGKDPRVHLRSDNAVEFAVSPDGKWVAFSERFNTYIAPFVATGQAVSIGPKTSAIPVRQVSRDSGNYLHWAGDSSSLHWSLGPELFTRDLQSTFAFLEGAPDDLPEPTAQGRNISWQAETDVPTGSVAFVGARVITMNGEEVIEDGTVVVENNRIAAVGPRTEVDVPSGAHVVEAEGRTLMPGIIDVHAHGPQGSNEVVPQQNREHFATLTFGVTTIHDPSNDTSTIFAASEMAKAGHITAPRIYSTGTILYGAAGSFKAEVDSLEDARSHLRRMKAQGAFSVKSYNQPRRDQRQQVIAAARELEMLVFPEGGSLFEHNMTMVIDGHTGIEHAIPVSNVYGDVLDLWPATEVGYTPTLVVAYGGRWGEDYWYQKTKVWENERLLRYVPREFVDARSRRRTMIPENEFNHIDSARVCHELAEQGVKVNIGAHGQREGLGAHWEIWMLVQGGMTPHQALRSATYNGAHYLGMLDDLGTVETGKLADLILIDGNPLQDIRTSENVDLVMVNGRLYDALTLDQVGNHPKAREPFYFER